MGMGTHVWRVHGNGRNHVVKGGSGWNRGLSKKTDERARLQGETLKARLISGEVKQWQTGLTKATDSRVAKLSATLVEVINRKIQYGTWHNSFARSRKHIYKGESFDGRWEVKLAIWFDENSISWIRNKRNFPYVFDKPRRYTPDFFFPHINCYVEVKGWKTSKDEAKWQQFTDKLIVLSGSDLQSLGIDVEVRKDWKTL